MEFDKCDERSDQAGFKSNSTTEERNDNKIVLSTTNLFQQCFNSEANVNNFGNNFKTTEILSNKSEDVYNQPVQFTIQTNNLKRKYVVLMEHDSSILCDSNHTATNESRVICKYPRSNSLTVTMDRDIPCEQTTRLLLARTHHKCYKLTGCFTNKPLKLFLNWVSRDIHNDLTNNIFTVSLKHLFLEMFCRYSSSTRKLSIPFSLGNIQVTAKLNKIVEHVHLIITEINYYKLSARKYDPIVTLYPKTHISPSDVAEITGKFSMLTVTNMLVLVKHTCKIIDPIVLSVELNVLKDNIANHILNLTNVHLNSNFNNRRLHKHFNECTNLNQIQVISTKTNLYEKELPIVIPCLLKQDTISNNKIVSSQVVVDGKICKTIGKTEINKKAKFKRIKKQQSVNTIVNKNMVSDTSSDASRHRETNFSKKRSAPDFDNYSVNNSKRHKPPSSTTIENEEQDKVDSFIDVEEYRDNNNPKWNYCKVNNLSEAISLVKSQWQIQSLSDPHKEHTSRFCHTPLSSLNISELVPPSTIPCYTIYDEKIEEIDKKLVYITRELVSLYQRYSWFCDNYNVQCEINREINRCKVEEELLKDRYAALCDARMETQDMLRVYGGTIHYNAVHISNDQKSENVEQRKVIDGYESFYGLTK